MACLKKINKSVFLFSPLFFLFPTGFFFHKIKNIRELSSLTFLAKFTIHRTVGEEGGYFFNSFLPLPPVSETSSISWVTAAESSPLHIVSGWTRNSFERKSLTTKLRAVYISFKYQISSQAQNLVIMLKIHCKISPQKCE